jgi:hypothetical protein
MENNLPTEIRNLVDSLNFSALAFEIGRSTRLNIEETNGLESVLKDFIENIWTDSNQRFDSFKIKDFNSEENKLLNHDFYDFFIQKIIERLAEIGFNEKTVLYENKFIVLTAYFLQTDRYEKHETHRIMRKGNFFSKRYKVLSKKYHTVIPLNADYSEKGRWGEDVSINPEFETPEEAEIFLKQLEKAVMVGRFVSFADIFNRFSVKMS